MSATYTLTIAVEAHQYYGEFYFVGDEYQTGADVLIQVAADHIMAMKQRPHVEEYLLETLKEGKNARKSEYEQADPTVACRVHFDVSYQRFAFSVDDYTVEIGQQPTKDDLRSIAEDLPD